MPKFPRVVHIVWETPERDDPYMMVRPDGVAGIDENARPMAVYKLVTVGKVQVTRQLVTTGRRS